MPLRKPRIFPLRPNVIYQYSFLHISWSRGSTRSLIAKQHDWRKRYCSSCKPTLRKEPGTEWRIRNDERKEVSKLKERCKKWKKGNKIFLNWLWLRIIKLFLILSSILIYRNFLFNLMRILRRKSLEISSRFHEDGIFLVFFQGYL